MTADETVGYKLVKEHLVFDEENEWFYIDDPDVIETAINQAIQTATAELQRENEQALQAFKELQTELRQEGHSVKRLQQELETATKYKDDAYQRANQYRDENTQLKAQLSERDAQLLALRDGIESAGKRFRMRSFADPENWLSWHTGEMDGGEPVISQTRQLFFPDWGCVDNPCEYPQLMMQEFDELLTNTHQAAKEAKKRIREEAVKECIEVIEKDYFHLIGTGTMTEALQSLIEGNK